LRAFLTPIRAGSPLIGQSYFAEPLLGAVGGAYAGNHIEKSTKGSKRYDVVVRFEDGSARTFSSDSLPAWHSGDRVRLQNGALIFDGGRSGANGFGAA
jgi:outer membrane lipoprotein SlyB